MISIQTIYTYTCDIIHIFNIHTVHKVESRLPGCDEPGPRYGLALSSEQVSDFELKGLWKDSFPAYLPKLDSDIGFDPNLESQLRLKHLRSNF